ncbi:MAG: hypothetical protein HC881_01870 [Leptolyngbyaceae cyanobacterium SL_7_1]|nr:hypothetical protein [Leptolyngbyaceae cyanobacterium SL_7_1]
MPKRVRSKSCDRCSIPAEILYRVQYDDSGRWKFVCLTCYPIVSRNNPAYVYGGTWKAEKY